MEALWRGQRLRALTALPELIAAAPDGAGGYHLAVIRHGQLAAAGTARRGVPPMPVVDAIHAGAQAILPMPAPLGGALVEETALIARWLATPGVRIVRVAEPDAPDSQAGPLRCGRPAPGPAGQRWHGRRDWPASRLRQAQTCSPNRTHRASRSSAAPESMAVRARRSPSSHAGSHSARLDRPA